MLKTTGIHHISSIVGHAQRNADFYAGFLGLRLVKKTLNFDDKENYHLYYGNTDASTGLVTTFPWTDAVEGRIGDGQVGVASYAIAPDSFDFWRDRFAQFEIPFFEYTRFNKRRIGFRDPDGLELEFIEGDYNTDMSWEYNGVTKKDAFIGIHNAALYSGEPEKTLKLLTDVMGYEKVDEDEEFIQLKVNDDLGGVIEMNKKTRGRGRMGIGAVHHIAFKVTADDIHDWREKLIKAGYQPTEVKDRKYFQALYFREKGGILIELSTLGPGATVDETVEELGKNLLIPPHFVDQTEEIIANLMPVEVEPITKMREYGYRDRYEYDVLQKKAEIKGKLDRLKAVKEQRELTPAEERDLELLRHLLVKTK